ncbi:MAG: M24 family metallopeptidase [Nitrososphaeria archaeon]
MATFDKYLEISINASKEAYKSLIRNMIEENLDTLLLFREENIRYVSALRLIIAIRTMSNSYACIVNKDGVTILANEDEYNRLKDYGSWVNIVKYENEGHIGKLRQLLKEDSKVGYEDLTITQSLYKELNTYYKLKPASSIILKTRMIKNSYEKELIKKGAEILVHAVSEVQKIFRRGMTETELQGELEKIIREDGAEGFGTWGLTTSDSGLKYVHYFPLPGKEIKGMFNVNISTIFFGYYSDIARIFSVGRVSPEIREKYALFSKLNASLISELRPGNRTGFIFKKFEIEYQKMSSKLTHSLGRGIGVELLEPPFIINGVDEKIMPDETISTNPWLNFNDKSFKLVDTLIVEKDKTKIYTDFPYEIIEI